MAYRAKMGLAAWKNREGEWNPLATELEKSKQANQRGSKVNNGSVRAVGVPSGQEFPTEEGSRGLI